MTNKLELMCMTNVRCVTTALAVTILAVPAISAQNSGPKMIPTVLAQAMLGDFGEMMGGVTFVVGKSPDRWPKFLVAPVQARIVGGGKFGPLLTTLYEFQRKGDATGSFESQLLKAGFHKAAVTGFPHEKGFASSAGSALSYSFCGDAGAVGFQQVDSTNTARTIAVVFIADKESSSACSTRGARPRETPLALPTMRPPPGVNASPGGSSSGADNFETSARVDTTLSASEVLAHYVKQLTAAGWKAAPAPVLGGDVALHQLSTRDDKGEEWHGALVVIPSRSQREITLRMLRDKPQF